jgi:hypothetical protein
MILEPADSSFLYLGGPQDEKVSNAEVPGLFLLNICNQNFSGAIGGRTAKPEWYADCESTSGIEPADDIERKQFEWGAECHVIFWNRPGRSDPERIQRLSNDWMRYCNSAWVLYSEYKCCNRHSRKASDHSVLRYKYYDHLDADVDNGSLTDVPVCSKWSRQWAGMGPGNQRLQPFRPANYNFEGH